MNKRAIANIQIAFFFSFQCKYSILGFIFNIKKKSAIQIKSISCIFNNFNNFHSLKINNTEI